ncbi:MAG: hypothetical protein VB053_06360 [Oscillibacter ruminantium]|uniref:hypothetical protein n=1 Tax=Oscillibacter ruminantium TaxID=1263547 RepID=UPI002B204813|nr:hypothetical protein [Oscillibacter ruminantium]MEA5042151.1 hypothetical protein [Oscillibacter ruminantium]
MPNLKEKPAMGKPKARDRVAMLPKQAARRMKGKYLQELDPRQLESDSEPGCAADQAEDMGRWAVDELAASTPHRPNRQRVKEWTGANPPNATAGASPTPERPTNAPKERQTVERREASGEEYTRPTCRADSQTPKERPAQNRSTQPHGCTPAPDSAPVDVRSRQTRQAQRQFVLNNQRHSLSAFH